MIPLTLMKIKSNGNKSVEMLREMQEREELGKK